MAKSAADFSSGSDSQVKCKEGTTTPASSRALARWPLKRKCFWEGEAHYPTLDDALRALDAGIAGWLRENRD
jgi:hypothetical protein